MNPIMIAAALAGAAVYSVPVALADDARVFRLALIVPVGWLISCLAFFAGWVTVTGWLIAMALTLAVLVRAVIRTPPLMGDRPMTGLSDGDLRAIATEARRQSQQGGFLS